MATILTPTLTQIQHNLHQQKHAAIQNYLHDRRVLKYFRHHVAAVERALVDLWTVIWGSDSPLSLLAIGGFGRSELYPYSDVDLVVVSRHELSPTEQQKLSQFTQYLWDFQLNPAIQSGSLKQLCEHAQHDLTTDTAFLESRYLVGDSHLAQDFQAALYLQRDTVAFIEGKLLERQQRHAKQPALMLEPNIKTGAGGLRDIHTMIWLAKAQNIRADFTELQKNHIINHIESGIIKSSHRILARLRIELHLVAGREEDRLVFDLQNKVAQNLGLGDDVQTAIEQLMKQFYRATKNILQLNQIILPMLRGRIYADYPRVTQNINEFYYQINHQIAAKNLKLFETQPEHIFGIVQEWQRHSHIHEIAPQTLRAWWAAVQALSPDFYQNPTHRSQFLQFFQMGDGLSRTMRFLNVYGVLAHYLPAWDKIVGLLQHDLFHVYPVDDHILMVLQNVRRFANPNYAHELPFASSLMSQFTKPTVLYLAALLHDIAKGRNGDHAILGAQDAQRFAQDHRLPETDGTLLSWLVEHHLLFSVVAQKQDIHNPEVVRQFCEIVDTSEKLVALYLLTVADIRGTNPKIWNSWKAQLLETLFHAASRHLAGQDFPDRKQQAYDFLIQNHTDKAIRNVWQALGDAYFAYYDETEIQWQLPILIQQIHDSTVQIKPVGERLHILVYMPNRARLFTRICRLMSSWGVDILSAKAFVTAHDFILDEFVVQFPEHSLNEDRERISQGLLKWLNEFVQGKRDILPSPNPTIKSRRARHQPIQPHLLLLPDPHKPNWYTLEMTAINRPALLADITEVFAQHQARLYHAKIATLADRAENRFLLHCPTLQNASQEWLFKQDVLKILNFTK